MTALTAFQRLEATGLWRETQNSQRREVVVSLGDATLMLKDMQDRALTHWSLAAIERANPGQMPALYHPDGDPEESLELGADAQDMVNAIERLRRAVERARPKKGRLRLILTVATLGLVSAAAAFWFPEAVRSHAVRVVPDVKRDAIGLALLEEITLLAGPPCRASNAAPALRNLARRILGETRGGDVIVLRGGTATTAHLPGGIILVNRSKIEDLTTPEATAGYILMEDLRAQATDPLDDLLAYGGMWTSVHLLTTGDVPQPALANYAKHILTVTPADPPVDVISARFEAAALSMRPYAFARDVTGETSIALIEADRLANQTLPTLLPDNDWLRLQTICQ